VYQKYSHLTSILPAMGYGDRQIAELSETIAAVPCDTVLIATPIDLAHVLQLDKPATRVLYELEEHDPQVLPRAVAEAIERRRRAADEPTGVSHVAR
jgi:predicted GTPase